VFPALKMATVFVVLRVKQEYWMAMHIYNETESFAVTL
jgi:hypothetical protein